MANSDLPIYRHSEAILSALKEGNRIILNAPTGSGKSTGIPPLLLERNAIKGRILIVQPRRLAARLLAQRVAQTLNVSLGREVGYAVRFEAKYTAQTKILFLTDGTLLRFINEDPTLAGIGLIIFDEFHERRISSDIALGFCRDLQNASRPELKLLVMSATLAATKLSEYLEPCANINAEGRSYPVDIVHRAPKYKTNSRTGRPEVPPLWEQVKEISKEIKPNSDTGNWLVFMPGVYEIRKTIETLQQAHWLSGYQIYPLYSSLPPHQQLEAIESKELKIIVATNVAETSLTIDGIRTVIDLGLARESRYDSTRDMDSLRIREISQASATQRAGRAGRTAEGRCYRLWSTTNHAKREPFQLPEALSIDLAPAMLLLSSLGYHSTNPFPWLDQPSLDSLKRANDLLCSLGAITVDGELSSKGRLMNRIPLPPRLASLVILGHELDCLPETLWIAASLQGEPLVRRTSGIAPTHQKKRNKNPLSDFEDPLDESSFAGLSEAFYFIKQNNFSPNAAKPFNLSLRAARELDKTLLQLQKTLSHTFSSERISVKPDFTSRASLVAEVVAKTFPDRICLKLGSATLSSRILGNRKGKLEDSTVARKGTLFFATEIQEIEGRDILTHLSGLVEVSIENLQLWFPKQLSTTEEVVLDDITNKIVSQTATSFAYHNQNLIIESKVSNTPPNPDLAARLLAQLVATEKAKLPLWNYKIRQWITRLNQLTLWMPELELPAVSKSDQLTILEEMLQGSTRLKDLKTLDPWPTLQDWLSPLQRDTLATYAPTEIKLSNGTRTKIVYEEGLIPKISIQLQKLYGVEDTPRICDNKVSLRIEILAPNQRPWQITNDLSSFWKTGYTQMKKDLAGRYPKHKWI